MRARPRRPPKFQKGKQIGKWSLLIKSTIVHFFYVLMEIAFYHLQYRLLEIDFCLAK